MIYQKKNYNISKCIYSSKNSIAYIGVSALTNKFVFVKTVNTNLINFESLAKLEKEFNLLSKLKSDYLPKAIDYVKIEGVFYLVMEYCHGVSLAEYISNHKISIKEFLYIAREIVQGLADIHQAGIIHKDINPSNIIYNPQNRKVTVVDLSVATEFSYEKPQNIDPSAAEGTIYYISPEQTGRMNRSVDFRTDFYSLGVTFFEMLCGCRPFESESPTEVIYSHLAKLPPHANKVNHQVPETLSEIIYKLMAKMPEDRYKSAEGILSDLNQCLDNLDAYGEIERFEIGKDDYCNRFEISQKLYGREAEIDNLLTAYHNIVESGKKFITIGGHSGTGKSSLVGELHKTIVNTNGIFISGKFDQYHRNVPYYAFFHAIDQFCEIILSENEKKLASWKTKIADALGQDSKLLVDKIPRLALLAGEPQNLPEFSPLEERTKFNNLMQNLLAAIASPKHPLVIFIDDIHLADMGSLEIIEEIMSNDKINGLLIISCYRNNEVTDSHPLICSMNKMIHRNVDVQKIYLTGLSLDSATCMLGDTLYCNKEAASELAEIVYGKTRSNPFYIKQFLKFCHRNELISFDRASKAWKWDAETIKACPFEENVVDFLIKNINTLDNETKHLLSLGACIGQSFSIDTLSFLSGKSTEQILSDIKQVVSLEIICPMQNSTRRKGETEFCFSHDRFQQTFYMILLEPERSKVHYTLAVHYEKIGKGTDDNLETQFMIADNYYKAYSILDTETEKRRVAGILLRAAHSTSLISAFDTALRYLEKVLDGLVDMQVNEVWEDWFIFAVYTEYHSVLCSLARYEEADNVYILLERFANDPVQLTDSCCLQVLSLTNRGKYKDAITLGVGLLEMLGVHFPVDDLPNAIDREINEYCAEHEKNNFTGIEGKCEATDVKEFAITKILNRMVSAAFFYKPWYAAWPIIVSAKRIPENGYTPDGLELLGYLPYALPPFRNDLKLGYAVTRKAMELLEKNGYKNSLFRLYHIFSCFICHWGEDVKNCIPYAREAFKGNTSVGEFTFACYSFSTSQPAVLETCENISEFCAEVEASLAFATKMGNRICLDDFIGYRQLGNSLQKTSLTGGSFNDENFNEQDHIDEIHANPNALCHFYIQRALSAVIYSDYDTAFDLMEKTEPISFAVDLTYIYAMHIFLYSLAICKRIENHNCSEAEQKSLLNKVEANQKWLGKRATDAPVNFLHLYSVIEAERASICGQHSELVALYEKAIDEASKNKRPYHYAIICELAALRFFKLNSPRTAANFLREAYVAYLAWGARGKTEQMLHKYPELISFNSIAPIHNLANTRVISTINSTTSSIDFGAIIKASQVISGEMQLDAILEKLIYVLQEYAGAQDIYYLKKKDNAYIIQAEGHSEGNTTYIMQERPAGVDCISINIVNYVDSTHESVILDNATISSIYCKDEHISLYGCKSLMCMPVINKKELKGILYLENNLIEGAFDQQRTQALQTIASQLAISLENSYLYSNLQQLVDERTCELREEITIRKSAEKRLEQMANYDSLTNLSNRRMFQECLEHAIEMAGINQTTIAVLFLDLDGFKSINDHYGHDAGDFVLTTIAGRLLDSVRLGDTASRMGGDEFMLIMENVREIDEIKKVCERIIRSISEPILLDDKATKVAVTVSLGISILNYDGTTVEELITNSDKAMYIAKNKGKNQFSFYSEHYDL